MFEFGVGMLRFGILSVQLTQTVFEAAEAEPAGPFLIRVSLWCYVLANNGAGPHATTAATVLYTPCSPFGNKNMRLSLLQPPPF